VHVSDATDALARTDATWNINVAHGVPPHRAPSCAVHEQEPDEDMA
jgi:hypothetical protein